MPRNITNTAAIDFSLEADGFVCSAGQCQQDLFEPEDDEYWDEDDYFYPIEWD